MCTHNCSATALQKLLLMQGFTHVMMQMNIHKEIRSKGIGADSDGTLAMKNLRKRTKNWNTELSFYIVCIMTVERTWNIKSFFFTQSAMWTGKRAHVWNMYYHKVNINWREERGSSLLGTGSTCGKNYSL